MEINLKNRSFLTLLDFKVEEIQYLLNLASKLKKAKKNGLEEQMLGGKNIALIFEKASTRTRCAFEVAAFDQGAHATYLGPTGSQIGNKESIKDTARVLGRMYDGIEYRGYGQSIVEELAKYAGVPVWNGLTTEFHPTQILADMLTMKEHSSKPLSEIKFCYLGDARNNMGNSLMVGAAQLGMDFRAAAPASCQPTEELQQTCRRIAAQTGARILITDDLAKAVKDCDFLYTDVWVSMGEPDSVWADRIKAAPTLSGKQKSHGIDRKSERKIPALFTGFPQPRNQNGRRNFPEIWIRRIGSDRGSLRKRSLRRIRSG